jgi:hypothetical protein
MGEGAHPLKNLLNVTRMYVNFYPKKQLRGPKTAREGKATGPWPAIYVENWDRPSSLDYFST